MISVKKKAPLESFKDFVCNEKPKEWGEIHSQKKYPNLYDCIKVALAEEQGGISAYTEEPLSKDSRGNHIDHFRKRSLFSNLAFDWNNLFVDGVSENYGAKFKDKQIKKEGYALLISPSEENVERFFSYMENGEIVVAKGLSPQDAKRAAFTIEMFNLTDSGLTSRRASVIKIINDYSDLSSEDIRTNLQSFGFKSVVEYALTK
ncbi:MAG: TIGR02646 family protein [Fibrobacter sp.]|mgnify:CR=1 FL=1|nr:TIGR02646 family protein [Fibrobacter sp.]